MSALPVEPQLKLTGPIDQLNEPKLSDQLLATLSEALSNTALHPGADTISVEVTASPSELLLRVQDNGTGFGRRKHGGLADLEHRARELGVQAP
ncbi:MAG TPA: ATP-binding protein [Arthrobacter sp.]|jgi:signal transduction histidine kinase